MHYVILTELQFYFFHLDFRVLSILRFTLSLMIQNHLRINSKLRIIELIWSSDIKKFQEIKNERK